MMWFGKEKRAHLASTSKTITFNNSPSVPEEIGGLGRYQIELIANAYHIRNGMAHLSAQTATASAQKVG